MWLAGGVDRAKWYRFKFEAGQVIEGAVRDDSGRPQGTMLIELLEKESTDTHGHWLVGKYIVASDSHLRWWMSAGDGKKLTKRCRYHCCEGSSVDCEALDKGKGIHFEKFRPITQAEIDAKSPSWAFGRSCAKEFRAYLESRKDPLPSPGGDKAELPWRESGEEDKSESCAGSGSDERDLASKLKKARDRLKKLERRHERAARKGKHDRSRGRSAEKKKKRPKEKKERGRSRRRRRSSSGSPPRREKERPQKDDKKEAQKAKKKRRSSASSSSRGSSVSGKERLFGGARGSGAQSAGPSKGKADRGPFGSGDAVKFAGASDSDTESFRDAPTDRKATSQLQLVQYARKMPGRLDSRLLLKMRREGAQGFVGAEQLKGMTPPVAVHYLVTVMTPTLGSRLNLRSMRELRTLCTVLDLLAQECPAQAADLVAQRVKALEKATLDGHWASAQHLELLNPEAGGLLERDEEVFTSREYLLDLKLKNYEGMKRSPKVDQKGDREKGSKKGKEKGKGKGKDKEKGKEMSA